MNRKPLLAVLLICALLLSGVSWILVSGGASRHIRRAFPGARPFFDPTSSPDLTVPEFIRMVVPSYVRADESVGFSLQDCPEPLDLTERFSSVPTLRILSVNLKRCKITNLCTTSAPGFPSVISFDDCDFSELPADQKSQLQPRVPASPGAAKTFYLGSI
jgi:hypothetical protein